MALGDDDDDRTIMRRPAATARPQPSLLCSVGRFGVNRGEDVALIRSLLASAMPVPLAPAASERRCDGDLIDAIALYQRRLGYAPPYGRVDPASATLDALAAL